MPTRSELEALVVHPENATLLERILAAPSRPPTAEERAVLEAFLAKPTTPRNVMTLARHLERFHGAQ